jgi:hypothetical protein
MAEAYINIVNVPYDINRSGQMHAKVSMKAFCTERNSDTIPYNFIVLMKIFIIRR